MAPRTLLGICFVNLAMKDSIELKSIPLILNPLNGQASQTLTGKEEGFHFSLGIVSSPVWW